MRRNLAATCVLLLAGPIVACHPRTAAHAASATTASAAMDTLLGTVLVTGATLDLHLALRAASRTSALIAAPDEAASLTRLAGVEVEVRGRAEAAGFRVAGFTAKRVDGSPVIDGILRSDGGRLLLETPAGRSVLGNPPAALRAMVGARVWILGPLATGPNSYGVIVPAR